MGKDTAPQTSSWKINLCCEGFAYFCAAFNARQLATLPLNIYHLPLYPWDARLNSAKKENLSVGPAWPKPSPASGEKSLWL